jgi:hypothetical protein
MQHKTERAKLEGKVALRAYHNQPKTIVIAQAIMDTSVGPIHFTTIGVATCSKDDKWDLGVGATIAKERALSEMARQMAEIEELSYIYS